MRPRVSFVVTCYNYGRFVAQAVDSLLSQTLQALEIIVVDDASTDETGRVLERYAENPRVRCLRHAQNKGFLPSLNEALALAGGEFVGILDADDFALRPDAVARQVAVLDAHPEVGFVYSSSLDVDEQGQMLAFRPPWAADYVRDGLEEFADLVFACYIQHSGTLVRRRCHVEVGGYDTSLPHAGDWDRWLRLAARYGVGYIAEPLYAYRVHSTNMHHTGASASAMNRENVMAVERAFEVLPPSAAPALRRLRPAALRRALLGEIAGARLSGRTRRGWQGLADAMRRSPRLLLTAAFYGALVRLVFLTALGLRRYDRLAAGRRAVLAVLRGTGASAPAGVPREVR